LQFNPPGSQLARVRSTGCPKKPHHASKSRLPRPKVLRIQQRYIAGQNQSTIAKAEGVDRQTVWRIVKSEEMVEYIEAMRAEFRGLVPDAISAVRHAL
jgi:DNA invertase Pin-like site-specific DNA recombinase